MQTRLPSASLQLALIALAATAAPAPSVAQTTIKFAAFGDIGKTSNSAEVAKLVRNRGFDFILMLGDLCYNSEPIATQVNANYRTEKANGKLWPWRSPRSLQLSPLSSSDD